MSQDVEQLDWEVISSQLKNCAGVIQHYEIHSNISSTNDLALEQCGEERKLPAVYFAEEQTTGRGRRGKDWFSPYAKNIYMSLSWQMPVEKRVLGGFSVAMGVAIARCLQDYGIKAGLKWPNDVMVNNRKMAGILVETRMRAGGLANIVIGAGINFDMTQDPLAKELIQQEWTDFSTEYVGDRKVARSELAGSLLDYLLGGCQQYEVAGLECFLSEWQSRDIFLGRQINILIDGEWRAGKMLGIERDGAVRVQIGNEEKMFHSAEISLRPAPDVSH